MTESVLAWVESPLQLIGAAEWAHAHDTTVNVAGRLTPDMSQTADELLARGARFGTTDPYLGIPFALLSRHDHWLVGDGFSGQFRVAAALLRPRRVTFLDDGAQTILYADTMLGRRPYVRDQVKERGLTTLAAPFAADLVLRRALRGRASFFTAFDLGDSRLAPLADLGFCVEPHEFTWTRGSVVAPRDLGRTVILGSALPVDGRMPIRDYLSWVTDAASGAPAVYLPHRRETPEQLAEVARIAGVYVDRSHIPVELLLAGCPRPLDLHTLASSTMTTLPLVLAGTGSVLCTPQGKRPVDASPSRTRRKASA